MGATHIHFGWYSREVCIFHEQVRDKKELWPPAFLRWGHGAEEDVTHMPHSLLGILASSSGELSNPPGELLYM